MDMKQTLERLTPETGRLPYWDGVLRDARPSRARWAAPRLAIVAAVLGVAAVIAVAPWKTGESTGVLDHALAAVGDGPVTHLVLRGEFGGTLVDLQSGKREPLHGEREIWIDPERGLSQINRFGGVVQYRSVSPRSNIEKPFGVLASGYREALESGRARLVGPGIVEGIPIYWIQIRRHVLPDVGDGKEHVWAQEIAVARDSYEPVYLRETRDGKQQEHSGSRVLLAERLPAGSGDFTPESRGPRPVMVFGVSPQSISRDEALGIFDGKTAWLGESFRGLPLAKTGKLTLKSGTNEMTGVSLVYGAVSSAGEPVGETLITVHQSPGPHPALERGIGNYSVPEGKVVLLPIGNASLHYRGVYVNIWARGGAESEEVALAAAKALRPLSAGSGAGG
jgi:hypothetical protein